MQMYLLMQEWQQEQVGNRRAMLELSEVPIGEYSKNDTVIPLGGWGALQRLATK